MATEALKLGAGLSLPADTATQAIAFLGRRGSGKSYAASKLAEEMLDAGIQTLVLDPVGVWWGLRLMADGKSPGYPVPVFGGLHGDVPLEPTGGALIGDLVADRGISAVLDVSQMLASEQARFAYDFATRFFQRKKASPSAVHLFVEECQEFVPQNVSGKDGAFESKMLHAFERLIKLGRNFGIGVSLISQRPQEVNKKALNQSEVLLAFQMTGPQERKAIQGWVADKGLSEDLGALLPHLAVGEPHVWSPQWLQISKTVKIGKKRTFDASSTPKVGAGKAEAKPLAPVDLERIREAMAATIERAEADDPKKLRQRIAQLERQLAQKPTAVPAPAPERVEVPVVPAADLAALERCTAELGRTLGEADQISARIRDALTAARSLARTPAPAAAPIRREAPRPMRAVRPAVPAGEAKPLRKGAVRMLESLARRYPAPTNWTQCAQLAGLARTGGTFSTYQSDLRVGGYVEERGDLVELTDLGWQAIGQEPGNLAPQSTEEVLELYSGVLRAGARRMIDELIAVYPQGYTREGLADASGVASSGGTFSTYLSDLRKAGLIEEDSGTIRASALLMDPANA